MTMAGIRARRLVWVDKPYPRTDDDRFVLQREHGLHESVYWSFACSHEDDQRLLQSEAARHIENGWFGRGAKRKAKAAAQQLADLAALLSSAVPDAIDDDLPRPLRPK